MCKENSACSCCNSIPMMDELHKLIEGHKEIPGSLITILHSAQGMYGYLPKEALYEISKGLKIPISEVMGIVTFYSFFSTVPKGKYSVMVCMGTACYVKGAERLVEEFEKNLNMKMGDTSEDRFFSLIQSRCIGACGLAPVVSVNGEIHREVKAEDVPNIIAEYKVRG